MRQGRLDRVSVAIATGFYISYIPSALAKRYAPGLGRSTGAGFAGTLLGLALLPLLPRDGLRFGLALAAATAAACAASDRAERHFGVHDDTRIVIDETVGFWAAAWALPRTATALTAAFVLFRVLDSTKPPPCRWLERLPGGLGVVFDDVGAGLLANALIRLAAALRPGLLA
ncbi:MAG TPA: phosphatidylglycerophosphatase A [Elusimicrobiota bacterium]|jgi:phosphatidylglycerophosphatase A|nr:phosphatidylglycerophosphatase A [Elusimicrobiota bacterium]